MLEPFLRIWWLLLRILIRCVNFLAVRVISMIGNLCDIVDYIDIIIYSLAIFARGPTGVVGVALVCGVISVGAVRTCSGRCGGGTVEGVGA